MWRCTRYVAVHPNRRGALPTDRVQCPNIQEQTRNWPTEPLTAAPLHAQLGPTGGRTGTPPTPPPAPRPTPTSPTPLHAKSRKTPIAPGGEGGCGARREASGGEGGCGARREASGGEGGCGARGRRQGLLFGRDAPSCPDKTRGNCTIRGATRRRHADSGLLMVQNPPLRLGVKVAAVRGARPVGVKVAAVPGGGGRAWPGFEIDHSERCSRVAISRAGRRPRARGGSVGGPRAARKLGGGRSRGGSVGGPRAARKVGGGRPRGS